MQRRLSRLAPMVGAFGVLTCLAACGSSGGVSSGTATVANYVRPAAGIAAVQLFAPMGRYTQYVEAKLAGVHRQLAGLDAAIDDANLSAARRDWVVAHLTWLQIGQDDGAYGAFGGRGSAIDGTAEGLAGGTASPRFTGFHRLEFDLFRHADLSAAKVDAAKLTQLVASLSPQVLSADLALNATSLDAWVLRTHEILEDALRDSLSQDDDYGSDSDLASVGADVDATREMLNLLSAMIKPRSPGLVHQATGQLSAIDAALAAMPTGREPATLPLRARQRINADVSAALETLAPVSELMQISNAES